MTSRVSREDVEDELTKAGIHSPFARARVMRAVDLYSFEVARRESNFSRDDLPLDQHYWLAPGDSDKSAAVTRCAGECKKVKSWYPNYHLDPDSPTGHAVTCKSCLRSAKHKVAPPDGWKCKGCNKRKGPAEFSQEKRDNPRLTIQCNSCRGKKTI